MFRNTFPEKLFVGEITTNSTKHLEVLSMREKSMNNVVNSNCQLMINPDV